MKYLYIITIILVVYTLANLVRSKYILHAAHLPNIAQPNVTLGNGSPIRYIAAGDSTALGEGASSAEHAYTYQVAQFLANTHTVEYKNIGVKGAKTDDVMTNQLVKIIDFKPDIITLSVGANDITHLRNPTTVATNLKTILSALTEHTEAQIYITNIPIVEQAALLPYPYRKLLGQQIKKANPQILSLESDRVHVVDIHEFGWHQYPDITTTFANDQFHPSDIGYRNWTNAFVARIKELHP